MDKKGSFLALCLLDALEDEDFKVAERLILKHKTNPNILVADRGIAPIHYACGMENVDLADRVVELMLKNGGDPNVRSEDKMTPLHVAAIWGRTNIVKMLLDKGGDINAVDDEKKTPILYAIYECQFQVVKIFQNYVFERKINEKKKALMLSANKVITLIGDHRNLLSIKHLEEKKYTPNKVNFNFGAASPHYIEIAQRKKDDTPKSKVEKASSDSKVPIKKDNLFELTEDNLTEYSKNMSPDKSKMSFIKAWRGKVQRSKSRRSLINKFNDIDSLLSGIMTDDTINFTNTILSLNGEEECERKSTKKFDMTGFGILLQRLREEAKQQASDESFVTADNKFLEEPSKNESDFIKSPKSEEVIVQMFEEYVHTDDENGLMFYEKRLLANPQAKKADQKGDMNKSHTSASTGFTVPLDYDTEALRAELTNFGDPPGPITKSTKRLYTKRLIKYQRDPEKLSNIQASENSEKQSNFSVELNRTIRSKEWFERIPQYMEFEAQVSSQFQGQKASNKKWREGHLKTSFIYLLIDPRISNNLPGQYTFMETQEVWKKFLSSIFYVGKGKSVRPYSHLYEAMKAFAKCNKKDEIIIEQEENKENQQVKGNRKERYKTSPAELFKSSIKNITDSKKLERILDIWQCGKGVVCLHVFHNILPAEAYTREAAIIDALSLQHLTNLKRGDYYGCSQTWNMRTRKCLGIALLYKAMQIFLAEGESQLLPSDLI